MRYRIDHDFHIHSHLSLCSKDKRQTNEYILDYARGEGLRKIALTNHYWDEAIPGQSGFYLPQGFEHISQALPLPTDPRVEFLFGCECEMGLDMKPCTTPERISEFEFIIISTSHLHMHGTTIREEDTLSADRMARVWLDRLDAALNSFLPYDRLGIAHLTTGLMVRRCPFGHDALLRAIPDSELYRVFSRVASSGAGLELNCEDFRLAGDAAERQLDIFRIAKACGCKFYLGTDAHHPKDFVGMRSVFDEVIDRLCLTEDDKMPIARCES